MRKGTERIKRDTLIHAEGISKKFCRRLKRSLWYGLLDLSDELRGRSGQTAILRKHEFWANRDISFSLNRGECLGLIGPNGSGKTTLLKVLNGLVKPDSGKVRLRGRVAALIALGAGFNPILTGRENIQINASVLGMTKDEITQKFDEIVDFADIGEFIDCPVQSYSSGMQVRLGFAVATSLKPDVLLLDEVLAVGDAAFRAKCFNRIAEILKDAAVILVSHSMADVARVCNRACTMNAGVIEYLGSTAEAITRYNQLGSDCESGYVLEEPGFEFICAEISLTEISWSDSIDFSFRYRCVDNSDDFILRVILMDETEISCAEWISEFHVGLLHTQSGENCIRGRLESLRLRRGKYYLNFVLTDGTNRRYFINAHRHLGVAIDHKYYGNTHYQL